MSYKVGEKVPGFELDGVLHNELRSWKLPQTDGKWTLLLFYPADFTFVCPTEVIAFSENVERFHKANCEVYGVSTDTKHVHLAWTNTPRAEGGVGQIDYPLLADVRKDLARSFGILDEEGGVAYRGLFIIDEEGVLQHATINNLNVGRSVEEALRVLQACQYTKESGEVCPAEWTPGAETMKPSAEGLKEYARKNA